MAHVVLHIAAEAERPELLMRPWRAADMPDLLAVMEREYPDAGLRSAREVSIQGPQRWTGSPNSEAAVLWLFGQERGWEDGDRLTFAVLEASQQRPVGHVALWNRDGGRVGMGGRAEIGYWTAVDARGHSIAPCAVRAVTDWAFNSFGAERLPCIMLVHDEDNSASCRVAAKSGYLFRELSPANPPYWFTDGHIHQAEFNGSLEKRPNDSSAPRRRQTGDPASHAE